jgi:hypothetical protein
MQARMFVIAALLATRLGASESTCDRDCLEGFVDQYLAALAEQDPSKLPLAKNARYTENGQELKLGDGMWGRTVTLGSYNRKIGEMEAIALRKTSGVFSEPQNLVDKPIFHPALAPSERRPRAELVRVANSYLKEWKRAPTKTLHSTKTASALRTA